MNMIKNLILVIVIFSAIIGIWLFGNAIWILALANFAWMLVKNNELFSWWWILADIAAFIICLMTVIILKALSK